VDELARLAVGRHPGVPAFVYGHSLGGLIALQYITGTPIELRGAILSAPAVDVSAANGVQRAASGLLSRLTPNLGVLKLDLTAISRDLDVVRDYRTDPLNYLGKLRARTGAEILNTVMAMRPRLEALKLPLLVFHGTADRLVPPAATTFVAEHVGSADLTVKMYEGYYHEAHNEPDREGVLDDIVAWLDAHSAYHGMLDAGAPEPLRRQLRLLADRSVRYIRIRQYGEPAHWADVGDIEHPAILQAVAEDDRAAAIAALAHHLAGTALRVLADSAPDYVPTAVPRAVALVQKS